MPERPVAAMMPTMKPGPAKMSLDNGETWIDVVIESVSPDGLASIGHAAPKLAVQIMRCPICRRPTCPPRFNCRVCSN